MGTHTHLRPPREDQVLLSVSPPTPHASAAALNIMSAYSHDNRVKYVVRYLYDIDNNGVIDKNDFKCLAVRNTIVETNGDFPSARFEQNGEVDVDEFKKAVQDNCVGKDYASFPPAFKVFIENQFKSIDINSDGSVGLDEYRQDVITRAAFMDVAEIDNAYNAMVTDADKSAGGITLDRYKELYAQFLGSKDETPAKYLFGPLKEL